MSCNFDFVFAINIFIQCSVNVVKAFLILMEDIKASIKTENI